MRVQNSGLRQTHHTWAGRFLYDLPDLAIGQEIRCIEKVFTFLDAFLCGAPTRTAMPTASFAIVCTDASHWLMKSWKYKKITRWITTYGEFTEYDKIRTC